MEHKPLARLHQMPVAEHQRSAVGQSSDNHFVRPERYGVVEFPQEPGGGAGGSPPGHRFNLCLGQSTVATGFQAGFACGLGFKEYRAPPVVGPTSCEIEIGILQKYHLAVGSPAENAAGRFYFGDDGAALAFVLATDYLDGFLETSTIVGMVAGHAIANRSRCP